MKLNIDKIVVCFVPFATETESKGPYVLKKGWTWKPCTYRVVYEL